MADEGGFITFLRVICPKVNTRPCQEFELTYLEVAVQHFSHYATETPQQMIIFSYLKLYNCLKSKKTKMAKNWYKSPSKICHTVKPTILVKKT